MIRCRHRVPFFLALMPVLVGFMLVDVAGAQSHLSLGNASAGCSESRLVPSLGLFSAGYNYNSYGFRGGVRYNELRLNYSLPFFQISNRGFVNAFTLAHITDLKNSPETLGLADAALRFGGTWLTRLRRGSYVGVSGEYDATRRGQKWYSGGQAAIEMFQSVGSDMASLKVTYYSESAGDNLVYRKSPTGYEVAAWYAHRISAVRARLMLIASGYDLDNGASEHQRGWSLQASLSDPSGLFLLKGGMGYDSVVLSNYNVGAAINLLF